MIPRSLPPLPSQIFSDFPSNEADSVRIDSTAVGTSVSPTKRSRSKRKNNTPSETGNSHLRKSDNVVGQKSSADSKGLEDLPRSHVQNNDSHSPLPQWDDSKKTMSAKLGNVSVLSRLKLKRQNLRDVEENSEMCGERTVESTFSKNFTEKLPFSVSNCLNGNEVSQPVAKLFVEEESGFRVINDVSGPVNQTQDVRCDNQPTREVQSAVELAVKTEKFFHTFSTFCHGLLAGMALWQCIIVYQLGPPHFETADFFSHYSSLSQPMQTLFYFFFVVCIVSAFDRYDVGNPQCSNSKCALACRSGIIIVIIYPVSLLLSLGIANIDDKMNLYNYNTSLWTTENASDMDHDLFYWKILNLGRCVGAVIGWITVALQPSVNSFLHRLEYVDCTIK